MKGAYIPDRGDVVWLDFTPQAGHAQAGRRPALVLSPATYNNKSGLMLCCPVTNQAKGYPFEVQIRTREMHRLAVRLGITVPETSMRLAFRSSSVYL